MPDAFVLMRNILIAIAKLYIYLLNYAFIVFNKDCILLIFLNEAMLFTVACGTE